MEKQFVCVGTQAAGALGRRIVTVTTEAAQVLGNLHQVGTSVIGRIGTMTFWVSWDADEPTLTVGRSDDDGFLAAAGSASMELVLLRAKRPNQEEAQVGCWPA